MADDIVKEALEAFETAQEVYTDNHEDAKEDIEFSRLTCQWPEEIKQQRDDDRRPCLTINQLLPTIRQVVNDARLNRPATAVHPVDGKADKDTAEILTGLIRNIEASSDADIAYDTAVEAAVCGGFGYWRVNVDFALNAVDEDGVRTAGESAFDKNVFIRPIYNQFSVYGDPYSQGADSSDWMTCHVIDKLTRAQFKDTYPDAEETDFDGPGWASINTPWRDGDDVQIAEYWKREKVIKKAYAIQPPEGEIIIAFEEELKKELQPLMEMGAQVIGERPVATYKVTQHIVSGLEELSKIEWKGAYIPIIPVYGDEVNLEGKRHFRSLIRDAKDAQQMLNYWVTMGTEQVALAPKVPYIGPKGAFETDHAKWSTANSHSHSFIEFDGPQAPVRQPPVPIESGIMQMALSASDQIKSITGIFNASLGERSNETSGKAIMARQREGDVSTFHFQDNLTRAIRHSGRIIVDLIPKVYSTARIVRILGEDGSVDEKPINTEYEDKGEMRIHDVRTGRYDVTVKAGPSFTSRREEAATQMMELIRSFPDAAPVIGDLLASNLDWPGADQIAKRLEKMLPPEVRDEEGNIPPEVQQQMQQMMEAINFLKQELAQATGEKEMKLRELGIKEFEAETDRIEATKDAMTPEQVQLIVIQTLQEALQPDLPNPEAAAPYGQAA